MCGSLLCRSAMASAFLAAITVAPLDAATTVASVTLEVPASHNHAGASIQVAQYTLDAVANFSLVLPAPNPYQSTASRVTFVVPETTTKITFATSGSGSRYRWVSIRELNSSGATVRRTVFHDVRIVRSERFTTDAGPQRRWTFTAGEMNVAQDNS